MNGHNLILGEIKDFLTGEIIQNTHDEQFRQKIANILVDVLGYNKAEIESRLKIRIKVEDKAACIFLDFAVKLSGMYYMIIKYGHGSLVARHRPALSLSRLLAPYQIPFVAVTNGEDADVLDGKTGDIIFSGLNNIFSKQKLLEFIDITKTTPISSKQVEMESRIIYAFEIYDKCTY